MGINFPSSPADGAILNASPGVSFVARGGKWQPAPLKTALPKNYLVNPTMQVSQENGDVQSATGPSVQFYAADQWFAAFDMGAGGFWVQRGRTTDTGNDLIMLNCVTPVASPGVNAHWQLFQYIEGQRAADFQWGTPKAQQAIFHFNFLVNQGGTYTVHIKTLNGSRCFLAPFVIPSNVWKQFDIIVPGDTTGTWPIDNTGGIQVSIGLAAGSTFGGGTAGWSAVNKVTIAGSTNGAAVAGAFLFGDAGFYLDPYLTGVAPPFEVPTMLNEIRRCQRYWYKAFGARGLVVSAAVLNALNNIHPVPMRAKPTAAISGTATGYDCSTTPAITSISSNPSNSWALELNTGTTGLIAARPGGHIWGGAGTPANNCFLMNSRM